MKRKLLLFSAGAACFVVSQPVLRMPILIHLQTNTKFLLLYKLYPLIVGIIIVSSAGIFEEGFRFIFRKFLFKSGRLGLAEPVIFGLGHGLVEAMIVLGPYLLFMPLKSLYLGIIERILAIILHIGLTVIIWNGFQLNQKYRYLGLAILIHGLANSLIPIFAEHPNGIVIIESSLAFIDTLIIMYIIKSRKYYKNKM